MVWTPGESDGPTGSITGRAGIEGRRGDTPLYSMALLYKNINASIGNRSFFSPEPVTHTADKNPLGMKFSCAGRL